MQAVHPLPQVIQWIQEPTDTNTLRDFQQWKEKCDVKVSPPISLISPHGFSKMSF